MGALEPKFWAAFCRGVDREDLLAHQFDAPGSPRTGSSQICDGRTRAEWEAFNAEHDCCVEPVLELDEALADEQCGRADGRRRRCSATRCGWGDARGPARGPAPGLGEHTDEVLSEAGFDVAEIPAPGRRTRSSDRRFLRRRRGEGRYLATERTSGPWDANHQHAGPPSALLTGCLSAVAARGHGTRADDRRDPRGGPHRRDGSRDVGRAAGAVGRAVAGEVRAGGRPVMRARAWRVLGSPVGTHEGPRLALPDADEPPRRCSARSSAMRTPSSGGG